MKLAEHFETFLTDIVNLNQTRIDVLEARVDAIEEFLSNSDFHPRIWRYSRQGSWAVETIIRPPNGNDFDADLLVIIEPVDGWEPEEYIEELYRVFRASDRYKPLVGYGTRCVTLDYANDFHLDLVICIRVKNGDDVSFLVCNRNTNTFEPTDGEGFADWFCERNAITGGNRLRKVTRLFKYLRDIKRTFSAKSVLLTTLLGETVKDWHSDFQDHFYADVPTALKTIVGHLDDWLQERPLMPTVSNPALPGENFNRHWDQEKYENFRAKIRQYRLWIDDAYDEPDRDESIAKWRRVFGDDFAYGEVVGKATSVATTALEFARAASADLVAAVRNWGPAILQRIPANLPHVSRVPWRESGRARIEVAAMAYSERGSGLIGPFESGTVLPKGIWLHFVARVPNGIPPNWQIKWRIVNSGEEAASQRSLRGGFESGGADGSHWEQTAYLGAHWVEAFLINTRNGTCAGRSERFFVVIGSEWYGAKRDVA